MKVRMMDSFPGTVDPKKPAAHYRRGEVHEIPDAIAGVWMSRGLCAPEVVVSDNDSAGDARKAQSRARARRTED